MNRNLTTYLDMIRTVITPQKNSYSLNIPTKYIGRKVVILLYAFDEVSEEKNTAAKASMADFSGILSESDYLSLKKHTEQARKEWNRDI